MLCRWVCLSNLGFSATFKSEDVCLSNPEGLSGFLSIVPLAFILDLLFETYFEAFHSAFHILILL